MKRIILASVSGLALLGLAACSDSTDQTTTQSVNPPVEQSAPEAAPQAAPTVDPAPQTGTGGEMQPPPAQPASPPTP